VTYGKYKYNLPTEGAVVAQPEEQWWLIGSDTRLCNCATAVLGSNPAISPTYSGLPVLRWAAIWMALPCRLSSEGRQKSINIGTSVPAKSIKERKKFAYIRALKDMLSILGLGLKKQVQLL
jgi:hypothetical protein